MRRILPPPPRRLAARSFCAGRPLHGLGLGLALALAHVVALGGCGLVTKPDEDTAIVDDEDTEELDTEAPIDTSKPDISLDTSKPDTGSETADDGEVSDVAVDTEDGASDIGFEIEDTGIQCQPGVPACDEGKFATCNALGNGYQGHVACPTGQECVKDGCTPIKVCPAGQDFCKGNAVYSCNVGGTAEAKTLDCGANEVCDPGTDGKAACVAKLCEPGSDVCAGDVLTTCNDAGSAPLPGGTDCAKDAKSCVVVGDKAACAAPSCGDGKVNTDQEECDLGADNGKLGKKCDVDCKITLGKCSKPSDCSALAEPCVKSFLCVTGKCLGLATTGGACEDGDACTIGDQCVQGACVGLASNCDDGEACTLDGCDPAKGCTHKALSNTPCSDGNACTTGDVCGLGSCKPGLNACQCDKDADCAGYDDGNPCNGTMACVNNACVGKEKSAIVCAAGVCVLPAKEPKACTDAGGQLAGALCIGQGIADKGACDGKKGSWLGNGPCRTATCDPKLGFCVAKDKPDLSACDDASACTVADTCKGGACGGKAVPCDDANTCTADACDAKTGCTHKPIESPCDDGDPASAGDACVNGSCLGTPIVDCKADSDCKADAGANLCLGKLVCDTGIGKCKIDPATVVSCAPSASAICAPVACDPKDGACKAIPAAKGTPCDDNNPCTANDICETGSCSPGPAASCDDGNVCTDDECHFIFGCVYSPNTAPCDDGDICSQGDTCASGSCVAGKDACSCAADADCADLNKTNQCKGGWACNKQAQHCIFDPAKAVVCGNGSCTIATETTSKGCIESGGTWTPDGPCAATSCDAKDGVCKQIVAKDGSGCSDSSPCTIGDVCLAGECTGTVNPCNDNNPCTDTACSPTAAGGCLYSTSALEAKACDDANECTTGELCKAGKCQGGMGKDCDDKLPCTADVCLIGKGCVHQAGKGLPCNDGDDCTLEDTCDGVLGTCLPGTKPKACKDGNICTDDGCDPKVPNGCTFKPNTLPCDNLDVCNKGDTCAVGLCKAGTETTDCNDDNACTVDLCDAKIGCTHKPHTGGCNDNDACTDKDVCVGTVCSGVPTVCDDNNVCTKDGCDTKTGCTFTPSTGDCGPFAACAETAGSQSCAFKTGKHIVISELYVGDPVDNGDDFIELYNSLDAVADLGGYELQTRPAASTNPKDWKAIVTFASGVKMLPGGYLLVGAKLTTVRGIATDVQEATLQLTRERGQIRLFDAAHTLIHDAVAWGDAAPVEGKAVPSWFSARSIERRSESTATAEQMSTGGALWLAGNGHDSGDNAADFVVRMTPEPQGKGQYEPACNGTCSGGKVCDYKGVGADSCVTDSTCLQGCGGGLSCSVGLGGCILASGGRVVISEVLLATSDDPEARFIEIHNGSKVAADISGYVVETKPAEESSTLAWQPMVAQVPAKTVLQPGAYWLVGTKAFAKRGGGVDAVGTIAIEAKGGTVRLRDPASGLELDRFGWGLSKTANSSPLPVGGGISAGLSMARKANAQSNGPSMNVGGKDRIGGNALDTNNDATDWVIVLTPSPHSFHSGDYGPACGGSCASGSVCNYNRNNEACVDPSCNGLCEMGAVCNVKTGACDMSVVFAEVSVIGPALTNPTVGATENEHIVIYNPGKAPVSVGGMAIQVWTPAFNSWTTVTQYFPTGICVNAKNTQCVSGETCHCEGVTLGSCTSNSQCQGTYIDAGGFLLIVGSKYDPSLPKPDLISEKPWGFNSLSGALRLVRSNGKPFAWGDIAADKIAWGAALPTQGLINPIPSHDSKPTCSMMRRPWAGASAEEMGSDAEAAYYGGASYREFPSANDWLIVCPKHPRTSASPTALP